MDTSEGGIRVFFTDLVWDALAEHAPEISGKHLPGAGLAIISSWLLKTDPERPKKRSREITLLISQSALEKFVSADAKALEEMRGRVIRIMHSRLKAYTPDYEGNAVEPFVIKIDKVDL